MQGLIRRIFLFLLLSLSLSSFGQDIKLGLPVGHMAYIYESEFSPDNRLIVTASLEPTSRIWDAITGKLLHILTGHRDNIRSAKFNSTGQYVVTASDDSTAKIWDVKTGMPLYTLVGHGDQVVDAEFSPDDKIIATASWDGSIMLWNSTTGERIKTIFQQDHGSHSYRIEFSSDSKYLLSVHIDNTIRVWDLEKDKLYLDLKADEAGFSHNSKLIYIQSENNGTIYSLKKKKLLLTTEVHNERINAFDFSFDDKYLLTASEDSSIKVWDLVEKKLDKRIPYHSAFRAAMFNHLNNSIVSGMENGELLVLDAERGILKDVYSINHTVHYENTHRQVGIDKISVSPDGKNILVTGSAFEVADFESNKALVFDALQGKEKFNLNGHTSKIQNPGLSDNGQFLAMTLEEPIVSFLETAPEDQLKPVYEIQTGKFLDNLKDLNLVQFNTSFTFQEVEYPKITKHKTNVFFDFIPDRPPLENIVFSPDGHYLAFSSKVYALEIWDIQQKVLVQRFFGHERYVNFLTFSKDSKFLASCSFDGTTCIWDIASKQLKLRLNIRSNSISFSPDNKNVLMETTNQTAEIRAVDDGQLICELRDNPLGISRTFYIFDGSKVLATSWDGSWSIWNARTGEQLIRHFIFDSDPNKWLHIHPSGLFDASPESMELFYWTKGLEVIEFAQLKDRYWVPGLWEKVMKGEPLPDARSMQELKLQPEVELDELKDGKLPVTLTKREGGYGKVSILINGKEVQADARGEQFDKSKETQTVWIDLKDHPNLQNGENTIAVKASSEDGFVVGRPVEKKVTMNIQTSKPHFYAVVIGTGKYTNSSINLKYPEKDAQSMSTALQLGSEQLFGKENTHIYTMTTAASTSLSDRTRPTKENIKYIFSEIGKKASSSDVIVVYLSGHGIAWGGDQGDFYYVTTDATAANADAYNDEALRKNYTISTTEFTEYLKAIPANKQVMIIDACSSGKAVENLMASRDIDVSQIKAIDRMKDRTGMFVISGSAADAVSYEASRYGQGLLTYSILQAMKGAALRDGQFFDVNTILNYSRENVPKLAAGIGGIQTPQLLVPKGGSFDIGRVDEVAKAQIPLSNIKPVFVRTSFMDTEAFSDDLNLSKLLDDKLNQIAMRGTDGQLVFLDTREFPDAYRLSGGYNQSNGTITLKLKIKGPKESEHSLSAKSKEELVEKVLEVVDKIQ